MLGLDTESMSNGSREREADMQVKRLAGVVTSSRKLTSLITGDFHTETNSSVAGAVWKPQ